MARRPFPRLFGLGGAAGRVMTAGRWSNPISCPVCHVAPLARSPVTSEMSGVKHQPVARLILVGSPSLRQVRLQSVAHSSTACPRASSGWYTSQARECAFTSPAMTQWVGMLSPSGCRAWSCVPCVAAQRVGEA